MRFTRKEQVLLRMLLMLEYWKVTVSVLAVLIAGLVWWAL